MPVYGRERVKYCKNKELMHMITCQDILELQLDGVELIAGEKGLTRPVTWTYMVQTRPFEEHMNQGNFALCVVDYVRRIRHFGPKPTRSIRPVILSPSRTSSRFSGFLYCISARCIAFSCGFFGTYTFSPVSGWIPV